MYKRNKAQIIAEAVCGVIMMASVMVLLLVGIFADAWHPTWVIVPCSGLVCGIVSVIINSYVKLNDKEQPEAVVSEEKSSDKKK